MTKANLPHPAGKHSGLTLFLTLTARVLFALCIIHSSVTVVSNAQARTDNRRLFYTGSNGAVWDTTTASWMTSGSFLAYAHAGGAVWHTTIPGTGDPVMADPAATFVGGDVVIFDSISDVPPVIDPDTGQLVDGNPLFSRTINIASGSVKVSDIVVAGGGSFVFTGGAITADPSFIASDSIQLTGTGVGAATNATRPTGSLVKLGSGELTLSNTAANHFPGGIHLMNGTLTIADNRALGDNSIVTNHIYNVGGAAGTYGWDYFIGEKLFKLIQRPGSSDTDSNIIPAVVIGSGGQLDTNNTNRLIDQPALHVTPEAAGLEITGDIYIAGRILTLTIEGDTTISGRIVGGASAYGASNGTIIKEGAGTLTITGTQNWFYGSAKNYNQLNAGRVVITSPYALGIGATQLSGAVLEFRGVVGTMRQAFIGGGDIDITQGSDLTFNWRNGTLDGFDGMSGNGSWHPAMNDIGRITISGQSRFSAIASGTYSSVLGGAMVYVTVDEGSTLVLGREGLSARGSGATEIPMHYPIYANRIELAGGSSLILNPNSYLSTGALLFFDNSTINFTVSGVSRIWYGDGTPPEQLHYILPDGLELTINEIPTASGYYREYVVINQGANPLKDIALTLSTLDALHATVSSHLADELVDPVANHVPTKDRKWVNEAWMRYIHSDIEYDAGDITTPGMDGRISNVVAGFDGLLPGRIILGIHAGMGDNSLDTTNDTNLSSKQKFIGMHGAQRFGKAYLAASAAIGKASTDSFRQEGGNSIRGKWDTSYYSASIEAGATFSPWRKLTLRPYAGLRYTNLKVGGYYERGLSPFVIGDFNDTSAQAIYGLAAGYKLTLLKRDLALNFSLGRKNATKTPRGTLDTHYFDAPTTTVTLERGDYYSSITATGLTARMALSRHTIVGLSFDYETASAYNRMTASVLAGYTW
jgi:autotransporter-associated beta strand protein